MELNVPLEVEDPEIFNLIEHEKVRQFSCLELIASEVCVPTSVVVLG